jgi:hypothetical protein
MVAGRVWFYIPKDISNIKKNVKSLPPVKYEFFQHAEKISTSTLSLCKDQDIAIGFEHLEGGGREVLYVYCIIVYGMLWW